MQSGDTQMTTKTEMLENLMEVRIEIARINDAAGHTVFNPAATDALEAVMIDLGVDRETIKAIRNRHRAEV